MRTLVAALIGILLTVGVWADEATKSIVASEAPPATAASEVATPDASATAASSETESAEVAAAIPFVLKDQYKREQAIAFPAEKPLLICFADPDAADHVGPWYDAAHDRYAGELTMLGVGLTTSVPAIFRPMLRIYLRRVAEEVPILLDWKGSVCKDYGYVPKVPNILLIDGAGTVVCRVNSRLSEEERDRLFTAVDATLHQAK